MSGAPYTLLMLVPDGHAAMPAETSELHWLELPDSDGTRSWTVSPAGTPPHQLELWRDAEQRGEDVPLVQVAVLPEDQTHRPLPGHQLVRLYLSTSLRRSVPAAPDSWEVALRTAETLEATFAWSISEDAIDNLWAVGGQPWTRVWSTLVYHQAFLQALHLDPTDLNDIAGGGDVFRLRRSASHWMVQAPEGLGNESAAQLENGGVDNALEAALQRVSVLHDKAVRHWLQTVLPTPS